MSAVTQTITAKSEAAWHRFEQAAGGPARFQIVVLLACVLALDSSDKATVSAVAGSLKTTFHINNAEIGLLIAVSSFAGAVFTLPVGVLVDRTRRKRILLWAIAIWSLAMAVSGIATSYLFMLATRICVGAITAAAFPCVASLTGDFFPAHDRARMYGMILSGELIGVGVGFFLAGIISDWINWRVPFFVMAAFGPVVMWMLWRFLSEPARGGGSWIREGQQEVSAGHDATAPSARSGKPQSVAGATQQWFLDAGVDPREALVLHQNPAQRSLWWAIRYVLHIPTYLCLVMASSLAYFFFGGMRGFAMIYFTKHYGVSRSGLSGLAVIIGIGALLGVLAGGLLAERLLRRGWFTTRIVVPACAVLACALCFGAAVWTTDVMWGIPLLTAAAFALAAANPSYDAARLDVMHPLLWGRAESGRMLIRAVFEGGAPLLFGAVSIWLGKGQVGVERAFLLFLVPLLIAALLAIPARRTYPRDVATAGASVKATMGDAGGQSPVDADQRSTSP